MSSSAMSSHRSSSGVRNLRAMFENSQDSTSPEPRGRSPASGDGVVDNSSSTSRPLSKVRTSFVAVGGSGQVGSQLDVDKGDNSVVNENSAENHGKSFTAKGREGEQAKEEGKESVGEGAAKGGSSADATKAGSDTADSLLGGSEGNNSNGNEQKPMERDSKDEPSSQRDASGSNEPGSAEDERNGMALEHPDKRRTNPDDAVKEAPRNNPEGTKNADPAAERPRLASAGLKAESSDAFKSSKKEKASPFPSKANGKAKEHRTPTRPPTTKARPLTGRPSVTSISISQGPKPKDSSSKTLSPATPAAPAAPAEAPKTPTTASTQPSSNHPSPRSVTNKNHKATNEASKRKSSRTSAASAVPIPKAVANQSSPEYSQVQKIKAVSPKSKPRPKSPTRPIRLPASATAPTASSVAKTGVPPAWSPSRTGENNVQRKSSRAVRDKSITSRVASKTNPATRNNDTHPARSAPQHSMERPKSRVSTASTKASNEGFLARMMRPTASSASKTHEKNEVKLSPKRASIIRPKRKSDEHEKAKSARKPSAAAKDTEAPDDQAVVKSNGIHIDESEKEAVQDPVHATD
ncbi:MAG: hypothetical protein M1827_002019 [Pycnora praestabilis]|nr:MAG: hypothetical protein M1827_002019 [Pycnora praestabilis]